KELNTLLESRHTVRPIGIGTVFATHAGHPESDLQQKNRARYIFHVTTVQVNYNVSEYTPVEAVSSNQGIINCVRNALNKVLEVNQQRGVISPETTERYQIEVDKTPDYQPIRSIIFPLFGTGHAGLASEQVIGPMLEGFHQFLIEQQENIHNTL